MIAIEAGICEGCNSSYGKGIEIDGRRFCNITCFRNYGRKKIKKQMNLIGYPILDIIITGATGAGKSTTLNFLFDKEVAGIGYGIEPETKNISSFLMENKLRLWDTPGLGDGIDEDNIHSGKIRDLLRSVIKGMTDCGFIDLALVILDSSTRDMGTTYKIINNLILKEIKEPERVIIGLNQADMAMKGRNYDYNSNRPDGTLMDFLEDKVISIRRRIKEGTSLEVKHIVPYSAKTGWNIISFLDMIISSIPVNRRYLRK